MVFTNSAFWILHLDLASFFELIFFSGMKSVLDNLPELWDESQYEEEYRMTGDI